MPTRSLHTAARDIMRRSPGMEPRQAWLAAMDENPELAARHHAGADADAPPEPVTTTVDPGAELLAEIGRRMRAGASEPAARAATFAALPNTVRAWQAGQLVEVTPQQPGAMPAATYPTIRNPAPGVDPYHHAGRFHVSTLRRLAPGERAPAGAVTVEKFGATAEGGGSFVIEEAA